MGFGHSSGFEIVDSTFSRQSTGGGGSAPTFCDPPMTRRKLIQVAEFRQIMAEGFRVQGTKLHVVELLMFGFAYKSRFILL